MAINGFDTTQPLTADVIKQAKEAKFIAGGRYISGGGSWKHLTAAEVALCKAMGFGLFLIDEGMGDANQFKTGTNGGHVAGLAAAKVASVLGVPLGTDIFLGVDFDAEQLNVPNIQAFLDGYQVGASNELIASLYADGLIDSQVKTPKGGFVPGATGWPGFADYIKSGKASIIQHPTTQMFGLTVDPCEILDESVIWYPGKQPQPAPLPKPAPAPEPINPPPTTWGPPSITTWQAFFNEPVTGKMTVSLGWQIMRWYDANPG